jgi:hypothetical protein
MSMAGITHNWVYILTHSSFHIKAAVCGCFYF